MSYKIYKVWDKEILLGSSIVWLDEFAKLIIRYLYTTSI